MQIDFHHAVTFVLARLAGLSREEAGVVAHAAQYVDDATESGEIYFSNGAGYTRISSAHKMLDYRNFERLANAKVWVPFHFLPGNGGLSAGQEPEGGFYNKLICRPNSPVAKEVVARCIEAHHAPHALHWLGIAMHVYADTWAHQGFAGISHKVNVVRNLSDEDGKVDERFIDRLSRFFGDQFESILSASADFLPLGHGAALSNPDLPFLRWGYINGLGQVVERNNLEDFMHASIEVHAAIVRFRRARGESNLPDSMSVQDLAVIRRNFARFTESDGEARHKRWLASIAAGDFSFGPTQISYIHKGQGSWKHQAIGTVIENDSQSEGFEFGPNFLDSHWRRFHDALQVHRLVVLHEILPRYGICAA
jgi:hypothetical protein